VVDWTRIDVSARAIEGKRQTLAMASTIGKNRMGGVIL
jgi:hypothetical protein